jgi:acetylornithine deacetylase/succinyl-diaminopimelate desuccinylase-like protein
MLGFKVLAHGSAAHSGYPWLGKSAVSAILPALSARIKPIFSVVGPYFGDAGKPPSSTGISPSTSMRESVAGHKGMLGFKVLAHGSAAHSGYPWLGKSAVSAC